MNARILSAVILAASCGVASAERPVPIAEAASYTQGICTGLRASHTVNAHSPIDVTLKYPHQVGYFICPATALGHLKPAVQRTYEVADTACRPAPYNSVQWDCNDGTYPMAPSERR